MKIDKLNLDGKKSSIEVLYKIFSANEYITAEGQLSDGINILLKGKVDATFTSIIDKKFEKNTQVKNS